MKIFFIPYLKFLNTKQSIPVENKYHSDVSEYKALTGAYYFPPCFKSLHAETELMKLDNMPCPVCGVKTLSKEQYENIVSESKELKTPEDFLSLLIKNKEHIPVFYSKIIQHTATSLENRAPRTLDDLCADLSKISKSRVKTYMKRVAEELSIVKKYNEFSAEDTEKLDICIEELMKPYKQGSTPIQKYVYYIDILAKNLRTIDSPRCYELYTSARDKLKYAFLYSGLFVKNWNDSAVDSDNMTEKIVKRLFMPSIKQTGSLFARTHQGNNDDVNTILICGGCAKNNHSAINDIRNNPDSSLYFKNYIKELSNSVADGKIDMAGWYPIKQAKNVARATGMSINIDELRPMLKSKIFEDFHKELNFEILNFEEVPCACCGITTLTHKQRVAIQNRIMEIDDEEIFSLVDEYKKYLHPEYKDILDEYKYIHSTNPKLSQKDIISILQKKMSLNIDILMLETIDAIRSKANDIELNANDKKLLSQYINKTKSNYINQDNESWFPYQNYNAMVEDTLMKMESEQKFDLIELARGDIRDKHILQTILYPHPNILLKMSPLKGVFQNMLKSSVITADHIIPKAKNGTNEQANMAAFCKKCNRKKSDMTLKDFYNFYPEIRRNMQKYLNKVVELIKSGELEGYEDYPAQFAAKIKWLTRYNKKPIVLRFSPVDKKD